MEEVVFPAAHQSRCSHCMNFSPFWFKNLLLWQKKKLCIEIKTRLDGSALESGKNDLRNAVLTIYHILQPNRWGLKKILQDYCYQLECQHATLMVQQYIVALDDVLVYYVYSTCPLSLSLIWIAIADVTAHYILKIGVFPFAL